MIKRCFFLILCLWVLFTATVAAIPDSKKADFQYILTRGDSVYYVDMNSVKFLPKGIMTFWRVMDSIHNNEKITDVSCVAVDSNKWKFRYEEKYIYDKDKKLTYDMTRPSEWYSIGEDSPIEIMVFYILENHPETKNTVKQLEERQ